MRFSVVSILLTMFLCSVNISKAAEECTFEAPVGWKELKPGPHWHYEGAKKSQLFMTKGIVCDLKKGPKGLAKQALKDFNERAQKWRNFCKSEGLSLPTTWTYECQELANPAKVGKAAVAAIETMVSRPSGLFKTFTQWVLFQKSGPMWQIKMETPQDLYDKSKKNLLQSLQSLKEGGK